MSLEVAVLPIWPLLMVHKSLIQRNHLDSVVPRLIRTKISKENSWSALPNLWICIKRCAYIFLMRLKHRTWKTEKQSWCGIYLVSLNKLLGVGKNLSRKKMQCNSTCQWEENLIPEKPAEMGTQLAAGGGHMYKRHHISTLETESV